MLIFCIRFFLAHLSLVSLNRRNTGMSNAAPFDGGLNFCVYVSARTVEQQLWVSINTSIQGPNEGWVRLTACIKKLKAQVCFGALRTIVRNVLPVSIEIIKVGTTGMGNVANVNGSYRNRTWLKWLSCIRLYCVRVCV